jgi:imidazolonepropionase
MENVDLLIKNANELVTLAGPNRPRVKDEMNNLSIIKKGDIAVKDKLIFDIGKNLKYKTVKEIDAKGKTVIPGFVDPHTHLIFSGSREFELDMKLKGYSYMDILKKGGGIFYTVNETRKASEKKLFNEGKKRLDTLLRYGTTTIEGKSGYGLTLKDELKMLKVQKKLNKEHLIDIESTFLGAHAVPNDMDSEEYVKVVIDEMLPKVKDYASFCDVFCEKDVFTVSQSRRILEEGKKHGLIPKIHADEIVDTGGAGLAADISAISADHLLCSNTKNLKKMAEKSVIGVLLPGTPFSLMMNEYADARKMIDLGVPVALATDLNPNCYVENMQFMMQLGCFKMKMTPAEALCASTFNSACAIAKQDRIGNLERGKQADILIMDCPNHLHIPYHFGKNHVEKVIKNGSILK